MSNTEAFFQIRFLGRFPSLRSRSGCSGDCCKNARNSSSTPSPCQLQPLSDVRRGTFAMVCFGVRKARRDRSFGAPAASLTQRNPPALTNTGAPFQYSINLSPKRPDYRSRSLSTNSMSARLNGHFEKIVYNSKWHTFYARPVHPAMILPLPPLPFCTNILPIPSNLVSESHRVLDYSPACREMTFSLSLQRWEDPDRRVLSFGCWRIYVIRCIFRR